MGLFNKMRTPAALLLAAVASGVALVGLPSAASAASPGVIVYQCGSGTTLTICAISPAGGQPRTLAQSGYLAGVTSDGRTYGYFGASGGTWEAPVAGGAPTEVNAAPGPITPANGIDFGSVFPVMSSDGQHFLALGLLDDNGVTVESVNQWNAGGLSTPTAVVNSSGPSATYGWLGSVPLTAEPAGLGGTSWVCIGGQVNGSCDQGATAPQIQSSTSDLSWPSGSPDGTQIVATVAPPNQTAGSIALFSATTGAFIKTIATPPVGTGYAVPRFSPDGTQVVLESDPLDGGPSSIDVVNTDGTGLRTVAQGAVGGGAAPGAFPSWGETASAGGGGLRPAPRIMLTLPAATPRGTGAVRIGCRLASAGRCSVSVTVAAAVARQLGLKPPRHAKSVQLALGSAVLRHAGGLTIALHLPARVRRALDHTHKRVWLTITGVSSAPGKKSVMVTRSLVLGP